MPVVISGLRAKIINPWNMARRVLVRIWRVMFINSLLLFGILSVTCLASSLFGDMNSDGVVDETDVRQVAAMWRVRAGHPGWNGEMDMNGDGVITVHDVLTVASYVEGIRRGTFDFKGQLFGPPPTLSAVVQDIDRTSGTVTVNGVDTSQPTTPFTFDWGDGVIEKRWFPATHTYADRARNYHITITSTSSNGQTHTVQLLARFVPPRISQITLPYYLSVTIPDHPISLSSRLYGTPQGLTFFDDSFFGIVPRTDIEYVLSVAALLQYDFVNGDVFLPNGTFNQVVLRSPSFNGMYSLWYTTPPSFVSGDYGFTGGINYSSFFHEMGHNFTLNSPTSYYYGGKIDGLANAIFSETMANIFAHATAYEMVNNATLYGLDEDIVVEIRQDAISTMNVVRQAYERYIQEGKHFHSWNDPTTPQDETFDTFMVLAYQFFVHAEEQGKGYRLPLKRMMWFLEHFNPDWQSRYSPSHNTLEAEQFRATLMVAALSYGFGTDLRGEFRDLNFPIDDIVFESLMAVVNP